MDWSLYTENHAHVNSFYAVEFIAYERRDGGWDLFARESQESCPELEAGRVDEEHIFLKSVEDISEIDAAADVVMASLGNGYDAVVLYRETEGRRVIDRICTHLKALRIGFYCVGSSDVWELVIRRKDLPLAEGIFNSNI